MDNNTKLMSIVFNLEENPLFTREYPSDIIMFQTFSSIQTNTPIWTPAFDKSIFLTALQVSASVPLVIKLNRENNATFMSIIITSTLATYSESFPSPIKFNPDEVISISTNAVGTVNITLLGYEF
ncbi:hypothetical protein KQI41_01665 [Tissierella pigra]|uniref:hypothetical protein n=1 Tax=Tissierella pigra TaxID=2607614 RepID=UPI001C1136B1|nr:hypothetical protein [Tissierella pigra]MBU5425105.1 hypothetical protein [Tissierella pigra]